MPLPAEPADRARFARALLGWFHSHARDLPWRRPPRDQDPYAILVSEVMLQQTRVEAVGPYFERWMGRWPTLNDLARAPESRVLHAWAGLGYYSRARRLLALARQVRREHAGRIPRSEAELLQLPGLGPYAAAAVAAIAFGQRVPVVDGNVVRVLSRLSAAPMDPKDPKARQRARVELTPAIPARRAGRFAVALMELGATVCTPRTPNCPSCPVQAWCNAFQTGRVAAFPQTEPRRRPRHVRVVAALVRRGDRVLVRRRPLDGLLGGLWGLPMAELARRETPSVAAARMLGSPLRATPSRAVATLDHAFTHKRWRVGIRLVEPERTPRGPGWKLIRPSALGQLPTSTLDRRVLASIAGSTRERGRT